MPDPLAPLRAWFPVAQGWIYFNHAAVCPLATPVAEAVRSFLAEAEAQGSTGWQSWEARKQSAREGAARLLGCEAGEVALTTNTSQGLIAVAEGLPLAPGDEVIVIQDDFPANQIPWFRQRRRGVELVTVPRVDGRVTPESILERLTARTRVVAVPWVLYDNGFRLDLETLGAGMADHPALLCVDAIQGLGAFPLDVERCRIDFLSADSHKWMLGLEGIGIFYGRAEHLERLDSPLVSWTSVVDPFLPWEPGKPLRPDARRHEFATLPTGLVYGLDAALDMLRQVDAEVLSARILELTGRLAAGLERAGWRVTTPMARASERSGVLTAVPPTGAPHEAVAALERAGVSVTPRGGAVRFSPHGWNTIAEVDALLDRLPR